MRRAEALPFIENSAIDIVHPDLRNSGGFLESKRLADLADLHALPAANHNTGSIVNGCLLYTSPSPRDRTRSRMPSSA